MPLDSSDPFDYIVVGAGSAGCVVARRLSDDPATRVLLLEAGPEPEGPGSFWIRTPAGMAFLFRDKRFNWCYQTEPVPALNGRRVYWPRGKVLGGSSAINGAVFVRGNPRDYDHWAALGNAGWGWRDVLPCFRRLETHGGGASELRGGDGPLGVCDPVLEHPTTQDFIAAAAHTGIPRLADLAAIDREGVGPLQANIRGGVRESSYSAFVAPVRHRRNLVVMSGAHVRRLLMVGRTATGVEATVEGAVRRFEARREVVLSAGALGSPHLLMLSGIGDAARLQGAGVQPLVHLPGVGQNLQDHFTVHVQVLARPDSSYNRELLGWRKVWQGLRYLATKGGYLALASSSAAAFVKSRPDLDYADLEISFRPMTFSLSDDGRVRIDSEPMISAAVYRVRPASRGEIVLRSPDPAVAPAFIPNYLGAEEDVHATVAGLRRIREIFAAPPLAHRIVEERVPGPGAASDDDLIDYMRRVGRCSFHAAGTCRMGTDAMAVVDAALRVRGAERLRVVDASVMPVVVSGNTNAATLMIGEKGADLLRAEPAGPRGAAS